MQWKLLFFSSALIVLASAQYHTIDNIVIVQPDRVSSEYDENTTRSEYAEHDNSSYIPGNKDQPSLGRTEDSSDSLDNEEGNGTEDESTQPESTSTPNHESDTSEEESHDTSESTDNEPNVSSRSSGSSNQEGISENQSSSESASPQKRSSEETNESADGTSTTEAPGSTPESGETPDSGEVASGESSGVQPSSSSSQSSPESSDDLVNTEELERETTHGRVRGYPWPSNSEIIAFYDIPYGKFHGPFETPVTAQSWMDVHQVTQHTTVCPQIKDNEPIGDSNCLTLSIFTPKQADNASVVFHVYDSYANYTSADPLIYGPNYLVPHGVILVLPNYRIGPMGFLCMQNETALGNAGLKDLSLALEWIKNNIDSFGGNPSNIVVSGDGAAGAYAGYLAICSQSKYYINKVITESGSALSHWALDRNPIDTAHKLAERIRAEHSDGVVFNNTFAEVALDTILKAAEGMIFRPCIEHDKEPFIDTTPWKIIQNKEVKATFMIGSASYAGTHEAIDTTPDFIAQINERFDLLLPEDLVFKSDGERQEFAQELRKQYFAEDNITLSDIEELSLWYTDASYLSPGIRLARPLLAAGATVYLYEFAFVGSLNRELEALHKPVSGAVRGDLAGYIFHMDGASVEQDSSEERMIQLMGELWTSFINNGKPSAPNLNWNEFKQAEDEEEEWLLISSEPKLKKGIHVDRLRLWTSLYDKHFIDNSSSLPLASHYLALAAALICLIANNKLNYDSQ